MVDFFFAIIELLGDKFDIDSGSSSFKTLLATTIIIEIIMLIFCIVMIVSKEYWLMALMVTLMIGVYIFSRNRIRELKRQSRDV